MGSFTINDVAAALTNCCNDYPPIDGKLHAEVSALCELYGGMNYEKKSAVLSSDLSGDMVVLLTKWLGRE